MSHSGLEGVLPSAMGAKASAGLDGDIPVSGVPSMPPPDDPDDDVDEAEASSTPYTPGST
jgi:hypothetical protein